jgi:S1-C subfamily serine protease
MSQINSAFRHVFSLAIALLLLKSATYAQKVHDFQKSLLALAPTAEDAVVPIMAWESGDWGKRTTPTPPVSLVIGTGFYVDTSGHFITAAHVANIKQIAGVNVQLKAMVRQKDGSGSGQGFDVLAFDADHDLALCQIHGFKVYSPTQSPTANLMKAEAAKPLPAGAVRVDGTHPFASLQIAGSPTATGTLVLVSGFPLGSWTPTVQLGLVAATRTLYPPPAPPLNVKDGGDLLQISVSANHGNSGGPIIDLDTGDVVGVLIELVPAPLAIGGQLHYDAGTFEMSGLMLAVPATWVNTLLEKNGLHSESVHAGKLVVW